MRAGAVPYFVETEVVGEIVRRVESLGDDEEFAGGDGRSCWESEFHSLAERPPGKIDGAVSGIVEFDELDELVGQVGIAVDLVDDDAAGGAGRVVADRGGGHFILHHQRGRDGVGGIEVPAGGRAIEDKYSLLGKFDKASKTGTRSPRSSDPLASESCKYCVRAAELKANS